MSIYRIYLYIFPLWKWLSGTGSYFYRLERVVKALHFNVAWTLREDSAFGSTSDSAGRSEVTISRKKTVLFLSQPTGSGAVECLSKISQGCRCDATTRASLSLAWLWQLNDWEEKYQIKTKGCFQWLLIPDNNNNSLRHDYAVQPVTNCLVLR